MHVLFIYPDIIFKENWNGQYYSGIAYISSVLKENGHKTSLLHITQPIRRKNLIELVKREVKGDTIIGISSTTNMFPFAARWAKWIKEELPETIILCGGVHPTLSPKSAIKTSNIDAIVVGEGEYPTLEICDALEKGAWINGIPNVWVRDGQRIYANPTRPPIKLDSLPLPDRSIFKMRELFWERQGIGNLIVSRGCPYNCAYCCNHALRKFMGSGVRMRSVEKTIEEANQLITEYPFIKKLHFDDDIFGLSIGWLREFAEKFPDEVGVPFSCNIRANLLTDERIALLKKSGCYRLQIGVESGNDFIRNEIMNRNMSRETIVRAFKKAKEAGFETYAFNMIGLPHENAAAVLDTVKLNAEIEPDMFQCSIFYPYPSTRLYSLCRKENMIRRRQMHSYFRGSILNLQGMSDAQLEVFNRYFEHLVALYGDAKAIPKVHKLLDTMLCSRAFPIFAGNLISCYLWMKQLHRKFFQSQ